MSIVKEVLAPGGFRSLAAMHRAGLVPVSKPSALLRQMGAVRKLGPMAGSVSAWAVRDTSAVGLIDEIGPLTYKELDERASSLARAWAARGLGPGSVIGLLARDHRGSVAAMLAAGRLGAKLLLANTGFAGPQLVDVAVREGAEAFVYDSEFVHIAAGLPESLPRFVSWADEGHDIAGAELLEDLIASQDGSPLPPPESTGGFVLLTSGTTGTPKGAPRTVRSPLAAAQFVDRVPLRSGETTMIAAPVFHAHGFAQFNIGTALGSTIVVRRRFDPEETLRSIAEHRASALVAVPTMLQRIVDLGPDVLGKYDTSSLRIIFVSGSALLPALGNRVTEAFGDVVYNLYGSTETSVASVATPEDWKAAPGTVGKAPAGCRIALFDDDGKPVTAPNVTGRIFAGSFLSFEGYTDGGHKEVIDGVMSTGDVGHLDERGLLFVDGRDDDMIISGGENLFPVEIEDLLTAHPGVLEAAVIGVEDEKFGQRPKAYVAVSSVDAPSEAELATYVKENLATFKVPREIVVVEQLPRNATGKVLKRKLPELG